jgi:hypothetical protein
MEHMAQKQNLILTVKTDKADANHVTGNHDPYTEPHQPLNQRPSHNPGYPLFPAI